jgi:hypothetical protein
MCFIVASLVVAFAESGMSKKKDLTAVGKLIGLGARMNRINHQKKRQKGERRNVETCSAIHHATSGGAR